MVLTCLASFALAQDGGDISLYAAAPPPGSAFVRVINASGASVSSKVGQYNTGAVATGGASPYFAVPGGDVAITSGKSSQTVQAAAGAFVSLVVGMPGKSGFVPLTDTVSANRAKASILLYNLTTSPTIDLATADGKAVVFTDVPAGTEVMREVNALSVEFTVQGPTEPVATFPLATLARGSAYSVIVYENGGKLAATWSANTTGAVK
jgi:alginate O-acetyltransferase complex protein AlgF